MPTLRINDFGDKYDESFARDIDLPYLQSFGDFYAGFDIGYRMVDPDMPAGDSWDPWSVTTWVQGFVIGTDPFRMESVTDHGRMLGSYDPFYLDLSDISGKVFVNGGFAGDVIYAGSGGSEIDGRAGDDTLIGGIGDDRLTGGEGADTLDGDDGIDLLDYSRSGSGVTVDLHLNTASGGTAEGDTIANFENLWGSDYDDVLRAAASGSDIRGFDGVDTITGDVGSDVIEGGAGGDIMDGGFGFDILSYSGSGAVTVDLHDRTASGGHADGDSFFNFEGVRGGNAGDTLHAFRMRSYLDYDTYQYYYQTQAARLEGGGGADTLVTYSGSDTLDGGDGDDTIAVNLRQSYFYGHSSNKILRGGGNTDTLTFAAYSDETYGGVTLSYGAAEGGNFSAYAMAGTLSGFERFVGSDDGDHFTFSDGAQTASGGSGGDRISGGAGDDVLFGEGDGDVLDGGAGNDTLSGGLSDDILNGGDGDDVLDGGLAGNRGDMLDGGEGFDTATFADAEDAVTVDLLTRKHSGEAWGDTFTSIERFVGTRYDDTFVANIAGVVLEGGGGADTLHLGAGDDIARGGDGNDLIVYHVRTNGDGVETGGFDVVDGGAGVDTFATTERLNLFVTTDATTGIVSFVSGDGSGTIFDVERFVGGSFSDRIMLGAGNQTIEGGGGSDILSGGAGSDVIDGGDGIDTVSYEDAASGIELRLAARAGAKGDAQGDVLRGIENVIGSAYDDVIVGSVGDNRLDGGDGNDRLTGYGGYDVLYGGEGNDGLSLTGGSGAVHGGGGKDTADLGGATGTSYFFSSKTFSGIETVLARAGVSVDLSALSGDVRIDRVGGGGTIHGTQGANVIRGGTGNEQLFGEGGNDRIELISATTSVDGGEGVDTVYLGGVKESYILNGVNFVAVERVVVGGNISADFSDVVGTIAVSSNGAAGSWTNIVGTAGGDRIAGGNGNDQITGGLGIDVTTGGGGADTFVYTALAEMRGTGRDKIADFSALQGDRIDLSAIDADATLDGHQTFTFIGTSAFTGKNGTDYEVRAVDRGGGSYVLDFDVNHDGRGDVSFAVHSKSGALTAADFIMAIDPIDMIPPTMDFIV